MCVSCAYVYRPVGHKVYIPYFIIIMFKDVCVLCLCSQGSWPQSVQPICYHNMFKYVFPVHVFTGQLATKCAALYVIIMLKYVCVLCLCLQGSWPQSVRPICYYNYIQVCVCPVPVFTGRSATKCTAPSIGSSCPTSFAGLLSSVIACSVSSSSIPWVEVC